MKIHGAGGIAAIRDDHHDAPAIAVFEIFCREINSVVERSARFGLERVHRVFDGYGVAREMIVLDYLVIEAVERNGVFRVPLGEKRVQKFRYRIDFILQVLGGRAADVDEQRNR